MLLLLPIVACADIYLPRFTARFRAGQVDVTIDEEKGKLYYPVLLYAGYEVKADLLVGLFESEVLFRVRFLPVLVPSLLTEHIQTWIHFNYGPSAATDMLKLDLPMAFKRGLCSRWVIPSGVVH